jgi:predicted PurR-regulated permease PerM
MSLLMLLFFVVPLTLAVGTIVNHGDLIVSKATTLAKSPLPQAPSWVAGLPLVGERIAQAWDDAVASGTSGLLAQLLPYADDILKWGFSHAGSMGFLVMQFLLTVGISALMYAEGEVAADALRRFGRRVAGGSGEGAVTLAGQAIRSVALGVGVTAVVQAGLGGVGLAIAGIPFASLLTAVMLLTCIAQIGPSLVLFPAVAWLYWSGDNGWGTFLLVWSIIVATMDNVLRPALIRRGADLPIVLIFAGVVGGLLAFGLLGIFVGPLVLAVAYTLLGSWIGDGNLARPAT